MVTLRAAASSACLGLWALVPIMRPLSAVARAILAITAPTQELYCPRRVQLGSMQALVAASSALSAR